MRKSQVNRARVAARATSSTAIHGTVSTNPALRVATPVEPGGNIGRRFGVYNKGGSGAAGYGSEWSMRIDAPFGGWQ